MCYEYSKGPVQPFATKLQRDIILIIIIILRYCTGTWYQVSYRSRTWYLMQSCTGRFQTFYKMLRFTVCHWVMGLLPEPYLPQRISRHQCRGLLLSPCWRSQAQLVPWWSSRRRLPWARPLSARRRHKWHSAMTTPSSTTTFLIHSTMSLPRTRGVCIMAFLRMPRSSTASRP